MPDYFVPREESCRRRIERFLGRASDGAQAMLYGMELCEVFDSQAAIMRWPGRVTPGILWNISDDELRRIQEWSQASGLYRVVDVTIVTALRQLVSGFTDVMIQDL